MKFSKETISILKSFSQINSNILLREGNVLSTVHPAKTMFAKATIQEVIPVEAAIYDLNSLLGVITLVDDQDIEFFDSYLRVSSDRGVLEYYYSDPELVTAAPEGGISHEEVYAFQMSASDVSLLFKAAASIGADSIVIETIDGDVIISAKGEGDSSNTFKRKVGELDDIEFTLVLDVERFKIMDTAYEFVVAYSNKAAGKKVPLLHMDSLDRDLKYWIAAKPESKI